jgi:hypothetical protein
MKLERVVYAKNPTKKWRAIFSDGSHTEFGSANMDDYTITKDKEQRDRYRKRHLKDLDTEDPTRAGFLAYFILWGNSTDMGRNIATYKRKFNL